MYVLGLDIGTTATKALVVDNNGVVQGMGRQEYPLITCGDKVEQNPIHWWSAIQSSVRQAASSIDRSKITAIGISTQGTTLLAMDEDMNPIGNAYTWLDTRARPQANKLKLILGEEYIYRTTGWRLSPSHDAAKIMNMKEDPAFKNSRMYISTLEYINYILTGYAVIDPTNAGIRQLFSIKDKKWDKRIISEIGINEDELPQIMPVGAFVGTLTPYSAEVLGLKPSVRVYNGAHDQYCASIGSGAVNKGDLLISTGTTWVVMGISENPLFTKSNIAPCPHPIEGLYGNMISFGMAGVSYQWLKNSFLKEESFERIDIECESRIGKNPKLIFLPWLAGNTYPFWNMEARGGFMGADLSTDKYDFALSIMESAAFSARFAIEDFKKNGLAINKIIVMGGALNSRVWMDILGNVVHMPILKMNITDTCAIGAAIIALCASGWFSDYNEAAEAMVKYNKIEHKKAIYDYLSKKYEEYLKTTKFVNSFYRGAADY